MATKTNSKTVTKTINSMNSKATKLSATDAASLRRVIAAEHSAGAARDSAQSVAKAEAAIMFAGMKPKPQNGKALDEQIKRRKAAAEADGIKAECSTSDWKNAWTHLGVYLYIMLRPSAATEREVSGKKITLSSTSVGTNARNAQTLAAHIREQEGTGKPRAKRAPSHNESTAKYTPADVQRIAEKEFHVNQDSVRALIKRVMDMKSGAGLIADALKPYGWSLAKIAASAAPQKAATDMVGFQQQSAEVKAQADAAMKKVATRAKARAAKARK